MILGVTKGASTVLFILGQFVLLNYILNFVRRQLQRRLEANVAIEPSCCIADLNLAPAQRRQHSRSNVLRNWS